jgi:hypothetical protein
MAIRRAVEELKVAADYEQVCRVVQAAFETNDFDSLEWELDSDGLGLHLVQQRADMRFRWQRAPEGQEGAIAPSWKLQLDLLTNGGRYLGHMVLFRRYSHRALQLDINLLTAAFPGALADALDRTLQGSVLPLVKPEAHPALLRTQIN